MRLMLSCSAAAALLASPALPQQPVPPGRLQPITAPVRDAGTLDVSTGKWTRPAQRAQKAGGVQVIFDNTCFWQGLGYYAGAEPCEDLYDEGRIPSPTSPGAPVGAQTANVMSSVRVAYCTFAGNVSSTGGYALELGFWNNLGGDCVGGAPPTPPPASSTATAFFDLSGMGLPGSTAVGFQACWIVTLDVSNTGWVMASDGDGKFDNDPTVDKFNWSIAQSNAVTLGNPVPDGFFIAGDPQNGGYGSCSYTIPCGTDPLFGTTCGTGLDAFDGYWLNVDGLATNCSNPLATNCYSFGGYPANPLASFYVVLEATRTTGAPVPFCLQSKPTSVPACTASLQVTSQSLATGTWNVSSVPLGPGVNSSVGIFIYTRGPGIGLSLASSSTPFGTLCLPPGQFLRSSPACAPATLSGGTPNSCTSAFPPFSPSCGGGALSIQPGDDVNVQCWYRDPPNAGGANLTNAVYYTAQ